MTNIEQTKQQILENIGKTSDAADAYAWAQCYRELALVEYQERYAENQTAEASRLSSNTSVRAEQAASVDAELSEASAV